MARDDSAILWRELDDVKERLAALERRIAAIPLPVPLPDKERADADPAA